MFRLDPAMSTISYAQLTRIMQVGSADLVYYLWHDWVFALQFPLYTMAASWTGFLTLWS